MKIWRAPCIYFSLGVMLSGKSKAIKMKCAARKCQHLRTVVRRSIVPAYLLFLRFTEKILPIVPLKGWNRKVLTLGWGMSPFSLIDQMEKKESLLHFTFYEQEKCKLAEIWLGRGGQEKLKMFGGIFLFLCRESARVTEDLFWLEKPENRDEPKIRRRTEKESKRRK